MTTATITANVSGSLDTEDRLAILKAIADANKQLAYLQQPLLPFATSAERKASYELLLQPRLAEIHASYIAVALDEKTSTDAKFRQMRAKWAEYTSAQRDQVLAFNPTP